MSSYNKLKLKIERANSNIELLIFKLIAMKKEEYGNYCVIPGKQHTNECDDCYSCKANYFNKLEQEMLTEYLV